MSRHYLTRTSRKGHGFTLIEVLVALVIVAVGMSALMSALTSSARTVTFMQDKTFAQWVALNQIALLRTSITAPGQVPATGKTNGDVDLASRKWHWQQEVIASQVPGIMRIDVKVRPKDVGASSDDDNSNWYVTVSGIVGNALAQPGSYTRPWANDPNSSNGSNTGNGNNNGTTLGNQNGTGNGSGNGSGSGSSTGSGTDTGSGPSTPPNPTRP